MGSLQVLNLVLRTLSLASLVVSAVLFLTATSDNNNCDDNNNVAFNFDVKIQFTSNNFYAYR